MSGITTKDTLLEKQYKDSKNLDIRFGLHDRYSTNQYGFGNWLFDQVKLAFKKNCKVLELGCGSGHLWMKQQDNIFDDMDVVLSDLSPGMVEEAKSRLRDKKIQFMQIDVESIPFEGDSFDIIIANHMLYHVPDIDKALLEIQRVLKKDGLFFASTVGAENMDDLRNIVDEFSSEANYPFTRDLIKFTLQNGVDILKTYFPFVERQFYEDSLLIKEARPLVDYVLSLKSWGNISQVFVGERIQEFEKFLENKILKEKEICIKKEAGLLIARKS